MKALTLMAGAWLAATSLPASAMEGVYGGAQCHGMKFDFRSHGRILITEPSGRESPGTYVESGDRIAVEVPGNGPGFVLNKRGDAVLLSVPGVLGQAGKTIQCRRPFELSGPDLGDPQLQGCWRITRSLVFRQEDSIPKDSTPDCRIASGRGFYRQVCKPPGKPAVVMLAKLAIRTPGVMSIEYTRADSLPQIVGTRREIRYAISGNSLRTVAFPRESMPDNPNAIWKVEGFANRVAASECN